jgi:putative membrane protein insertion efficiency factor
MKLFLMLLIRVYQRCLSPLIGNECRYVPSCSHYALQAIQKYGAFKGMWLSLKRIVRCAPWGKGGRDPLV